MALTESRIGPWEPQTFWMAEVERAERVGEGRHPISPQGTEALLFMGLRFLSEVLTGPPSWDKGASCLPAIQ